MRMPWILLGVCLCWFANTCCRAHRRPVRGFARGFGSAGAGFARAALLAFGAGADACARTSEAEPGPGSWGPKRPMIGHESSPQPCRSKYCCQRWRSTCKHASRSPWRRHERDTSPCGGRRPSQAPSVRALQTKEPGGFICEADSCGMTPRCGMETLGSAALLWPLLLPARPELLGRDLRFAMTCWRYSWASAAFTLPWAPIFCNIRWSSLSKHSAASSMVKRSSTLSLDAFWVILDNRREQTEQTSSKLNSGNTD